MDCPLCDVDHPRGSPACPGRRVGSVVGGRYRIERLIGCGGMGAVFEAVQVGLGRRVALKVMLDRAMRDPDSLARFRREATSIAAIRHPGIVQVQDLGADADGSPFMVMERLEGASVTDMLDERGALPIDRATWIAREALDALSAAHEHGLVHRDVKPSNLFVARDGRGGEQVKLLDFGLAKATDDARELTRTGFALGSTPYMSPEQTQDAKRADARADVYGMGVAMFEMLTGHLPVSGSTEVEMMMRVATGEITRHPRWIRQEVPVAIDAVVARALAKDPAARYPTALAMRAALIEAERAPTPAIVDQAAWPTLAGEPAPRVSRPRRTSRIPAITGSMDELLAPTTQMHATPLPPPPTAPPQARVPLSPQGRGVEGEGRGRSRATLVITLVALGAMLAAGAYFALVRAGAPLAPSAPSAPVATPPAPPAPAPAPPPSPAEVPSQPVVEAVTPVTPVTSVTPPLSPAEPARPTVRQPNARAPGVPAPATSETADDAAGSADEQDEDDHEDHEGTERVDLGFGPVGLIEGMPPTRLLVAAIRRSNPSACGQVGGFPISATVSGTTGTIQTLNVPLNGAVLNCVERSLRQVRFPRSTLGMYTFHIVYQP